MRRGAGAQTGMEGGSVCLSESAGLPLMLLGPPEKYPLSSHLRVLGCAGRGFAHAPQRVHQLLLMQAGGVFGGCGDLSS